MNAVAKKLADLLKPECAKDELEAIPNQSQHYRPFLVTENKVLDPVEWRRKDGEVHPGSHFQLCMFAELQDPGATLLYATERRRKTTKSEHRTEFGPGIRVPQRSACPTVLLCWNTTVLNLTNQHMLLLL